MKEQQEASAVETVYESKEILDELLERATQAANRASPARVTTIAGLVAEDMSRTAAALAELQNASIKLTYAEDWVIAKAKDDTEVGFLMDDGCQRVRPLWGVTFDAVDFHRDFSERETEDGQFVVEAIVNATSALTGEQHIEVGFRSSQGLFGKAWDASADRPVERARIKADIRKSALRNARGRIIRTVSGLGSTPVSKLIECGLNPKRMRHFDFKEGTKGGSGTYASEPQVKMICGEALRKVAGLKEIVDFEELKELVESAHLTGGRGGKASELIERLKKRDPFTVTLAQFEERLGVKIPKASDPEDEFPEEPPPPIQEDML